MSGEQLTQVTPSDRIRNCMLHQSRGWYKDPRATNQRAFRLRFEGVQVSSGLVDISGRSQLGERQRFGCPSSVLEQGQHFSRRGIRRALRARRLWLHGVPIVTHQQQMNRTDAYPTGFGEQQPEIGWLPVWPPSHSSKHISLNLFFFLQSRIRWTVSFGI